VQQGIEELLRKAASEDFQDPTFAGLKRQFQETVNGTLGERVIAEVIMTHVTVERDGPPALREAEDPRAGGLGGGPETIWSATRDDTPAAVSTDPNPLGDNVSLPSVD
jgi:hypothetical protein